MRVHAGIGNGNLQKTLVRFLTTVGFEPTRISPSQLECDPLTTSVRCRASELSSLRSCSRRSHEYRRISFLLVLLNHRLLQIMRKAELRRKNMVDNVKNERNILAITNNPFVVSFYYSFTNEYNLYIVMEYCNGGDCCCLLKSLGCMDEDVARLYIAETILALEYCHTKVSRLQNLTRLMTVSQEWRAGFDLQIRLL